LTATSQPTEQPQRPRRNTPGDDDEAPQVHVNVAEGIKAALTTIRMWIDAANCTKALVCLTGSGNFRKAVLPTYKANRKDIARPLGLKAVREAVRDAFEVAEVDGLEADDLLGLAVTTPRLLGKAVLVSGDKDMRTLPGLHLNPSKESTPVFVSEAEANLFWFTQAITGDPVDGYSGAKGIGPVKAAKALAGWDGIDMLSGWHLVHDVFRSTKRHDDPTQDCGVSLRVARILRHGDYNKKTREVRLWHPTTPEWMTLPN
jgi:DNA polymerase-1